MPEDIFSGLFFVVFWIVLLYFYPKLMLSQIILKLESTAQQLEGMSAKSKIIVTKEITKKPTKRLKDTINRLVDFVVIEPVSLDPFGIIKKIEYVIENEEDKIKYYIKQIASNASEEKRANLMMGVAGAMQVNQIAKIVRHFVEMIKRTKNIQLAMILQMQLPEVERIAKAVFKGTSSLAKGEPIGDSIGPLVAAHLVGNNKTRLIEQDTIAAKVGMKGRTLYVMKARGPGGRLGKLGKAAEKLVKENKFKRIITIDGAIKFEGEKTGVVAEGVGVAIGGSGVDKNYIENLAVKNNIPLDSILIKMSIEDGITTMPLKVRDSIKDVMEALDRVLERTKKGDKILVVGVGNTSGVGNSLKDAKKAENEIERNARREEKRKRLEKRKKRNILQKLFGSEELTSEND